MAIAPMATSSRQVGIIVSGDKIVIVEADVVAPGSIVVRKDFTWNLQSGDRHKAYQVIHDQLSDYLRDSGVELVRIKSSAATQRSATKAHLEAAELRGVVYCAAARDCVVQPILKSTLSRRLNKRKVDEYIADNAYWSSAVKGDLRVGSREAAFLLLS